MSKNCPDCRRGDLEEQYREDDRVKVSCSFCKYSRTVSEETFEEKY